MTLEVSLHASPSWQPVALALQRVSTVTTWVGTPVRVWIWASCWKASA